MRISSRLLNTFKTRTGRQAEYQQKLQEGSRRALSLRLQHIMQSKALHGMTSALPRVIPTYRWHEDVENLENYRQGGYHPISINDKLDRGRYHIIHKLGFGAFSTVWLAQDLRRNAYVAIKVAASDRAKLSNERRILEFLSHHKQSSIHDGSSLVSALLERFSVSGPNGWHECLVSKPARCSLALSKDASATRLFPRKIARAIVAQLILAISYLHSQGIVHADLHLGNILLEMPSLDALSIEEIYKGYGEPQRTPLRRIDGASLGREVPTESVVPVWLGIDCDKLMLQDALVTLSDFGEAFRPDHERRTISNVPKACHPPEANFGHTLGFPSDIWTLGCIIYDILGERPLFETIFSDDEDDVLAENISTIGSLPPEWFMLWNAREEFFTSDGKWRQDIKRTREPKSRPLAARVVDMGRSEGEKFSFEEQSDIFHMLSQMLVFQPHERITADELKQVKWMQNWGLPTIAEFIAR